MRSDNGLEFTSKPMQRFYHDHGILRQSSCVETPQQNGRLERKHRHILNVARALIFQANLPKKFWGECALAAVHLINRTPRFCREKPQSAPPLIQMSRMLTPIQRGPVIHLFSSPLLHPRETQTPTGLKRHWPAVKPRPSPRQVPTGLPRLCGERAGPG